ncbi:MAG: hypothetical protein LBB93_01770 [Elusimicrobiota bacterium]|jgi:hypothetical protein|nr:hypothetical protein [Elusimicrobiota bacterium]
MKYSKKEIPMRSTLTALAALLFFLTSSAFALTAQNVEITLPPNWKTKTPNPDNPSIILIAGIPAANADLFVMDAPPQKPSKPQRRVFSIKAEFGNDDINPIVNIYKMDADGQGVDEFIAAQTLNYRVQANAKVWETKDNYILASYQDGIRTIKQLEFFYVKDDKLYVLIFAARQSTFDNHRHIFDQINKSLKIK